MTFQLKWLERNTMLRPLYHTCYVLWILLVILGFNCVWFTSQDKILQSFSKAEEIQVTNDGATILKSIGVDNPAAKILVGKWGSSIINLFKKVVALKIYMIQGPKLTFLYRRQVATENFFSVAKWKNLVAKKRFVKFLFHSEIRYKH